MIKTRPASRNAAVLMAVTASLALAGCATTPTGPTVLVLPGKRVTPTAFQQQDAYCRQFASGQLGNASNEAQGASTRKTVGGTLAGTAAGALLGAAGGNAGMGAAIGAGSGLLIGGGLAALGAGNSSDTMQRQYNISYVQCMTSYGNVYSGS